MHGDASSDGNDLRGTLHRAPEATTILIRTHNDVSTLHNRSAQVHQGSASQRAGQDASRSMAMVRGRTGRDEIGQDAAEGYHRGAIGTSIFGIVR